MSSRATILDPDGTSHDVIDGGLHRRKSYSRTELAGLWLTDRLPMALRSRISIGARELGLAALVAALALCAVAVLALRSSAAAAAPLKTTADSTTPLVKARQGSPVSGVVVVDVAGAVKHPKVITLPAGSRVYQALKAAGGPRRGVDLSGLNLARVVTDGEQIVVGTSPSVAGSSAGGSASSGSASSLVSLNSATESELDALPGVGPVTAQSILAWRTEHGRFTTIEELEEVDGIGPKTFAKLKSLVSL